MSATRLSVFASESPSARQAMAVLTGTVAKLAAVDNDDTDIKLQTPPPPLPPQ